MGKADTPAATPAADDKKPPVKALTAAGAAKAVKVGADEVLAFRDYGTHVVVVTRDGRKLNSADAGAATDVE